MNGMILHGGSDEDGAFLDEGPHLKEVWGIFATVSGEQQLFGWVSKKKNARKICERRNKRYHGRPFNYGAIFVTTEEYERRITRYESQADLHSGLIEKIGKFLEGTGIIENTETKDNGDGTFTHTYRDPAIQDEADLADERVIEEAYRRLDGGGSAGRSVHAEGHSATADRGADEGGEGPTAGRGQETDDGDPRV